MASGDLFDAPGALERLSESGASGLMFARGALHNPAIFRSYLALAGAGGPADRQPASDPAFLRALILRHAELTREFSAGSAGEEAGRPRKKRPKSGDFPEAALLKMRGAIPGYVKDLPGSRTFRLNLSTCRSWEQFYGLVEDYFSAVSLQ
jgi:tRNA-dihydrouridine synthase B